MKILDDITNIDVETNIDYYKDLFLNEKIIGFNKFSLYDLDHNNDIVMDIIGDSLYKRFSINARRLIQHITDCLDHEVIITVNNEHYGQERLDPHEDEKLLRSFSTYNIHSDIAEVSRPNLALCRLIGMVMDVFTCGSENGKTFFIDREKMLEETPSHIKEWMKQIHIIGRIGEKNHTKFKSLDSEGMIWPLRSMPGIITHPVTGVDSFGFSSSKFTIVADDMSLESEYRDFIQDYLNTLDNWITWEWEEGKCIIWDNFNLLHTYSAGWKNGERVFSRLQAGFSVPFYRLGLND